MNLRWWESFIHRHLTRALCPFWWQREREYLLLNALAELKRNHLEDKRTLEQKLQDAENHLGTVKNFLGNFANDFERDIPSFMEQTGWECGMYALPDSEKEWHFNPSILRQNGETHLIARKIWQTPYAYLNSIVRFKLENNVPVSRHPIDIPMQRFSESFEDPRVCQDGKGGWWLSAVDFIQKQTHAHQIICRLDPLFRPMQLYHPKIGKNGASLFSNSGHEKNWLWFWHNERPHLVYWTVPHTVFRYDWYYGIQEKWESLIEGALWMHGEPRGGTNPILVGDEYWSFFHSFTPWKYPRRRYHMGAYAFEAKPPFKVTRMTILPLLSASAQDPTRDPLPITIFPCGALIENEQWLVVFGVNDLRCGWIRIPHEDLIKLTPTLKSNGICSIPDQKGLEREQILLDGKEFG